MNHYRVLGVSPSATADEIKAAFIARIKEVHPDRNPAGEAEAKRLNAAYAVLSRPGQRYLYDMSLAPEWCPVCGRSLRPAAMVEHIESHRPPACGRCDGIAERRFSFRANIGYGLWRKVHVFEGLLCRPCAVVVFDAHQAQNRRRGWWGLVSLFATIVYLEQNRRELLRDAPIPVLRTDEPTVIEHTPWWKLRRIYVSAAVFLFMVIVAVLRPR